MKNLYKLAIAVMVSAIGAAAYSETYAVMVGISDYPDMLDSSGKPMTDEKGNIINNDLSGCVNDVNAYRDVLIAKYGVKSENIKIVSDQGATEPAVAQQLSWAFKSLKPGDQFIFIYSGHGAQIPSTDKAEADGKDEVIVLADYHLVSDKVFNQLSSALKKAGINSTFVFDSCFSGGISRDPLVTLQGQSATRKTKSLSDLVKSRRVAKKFIAEKGFLKTAVSGGTKAMKMQASEGSVSFLMAGREDQPTSDLKFKDPTKPARGLFSLLVTSVLAEQPDVATSSLMEAVARIIKEAKFEQVPQLETSSPERADLPAFLK